VGEDGEKRSEIDGVEGGDVGQGSGREGEESGWNGLGELASSASFFPLVVPSPELTLPHFFSTL